MTAVNFYAVIPARYASTRLPGKPLLDIAGKPMVVHVADKAKLAGATKVVIATDDERILSAAGFYGYDAMLTRVDHVSGTDRIAEVAERQNWHDDSIIVNVQGDEPLIDPVLIINVAKTLADNQEPVMATACHPIHSKDEFLNPNIVKVVLDKNGNALYFSRAPIPYPRDAFAAGGDLPHNMPVYRHIGIYAYRAKFLKQYSQIPAASIEQCESLEQLRVLYQGFKIAVATFSGHVATGVDTKADLEHVRELMSK